MPSIGDKLATVDLVKAVHDEKLDANFSELDIASTPYSGSELLPLYVDGEPHATTVNELLSAAGGGGSSQGALVNYVKNCGTISSLPVTFTDANITSSMVVLESVLGTPEAQTGDWTVTTADGSLTISGSISGSTTLMLYFGVGMSAAPTLLTNLASTSAANILNTAPRPGVMGVLPVANGGTGGGSASTARTNLDVYSKGEVDSAIQQSAATGGTNYFKSPDGTLICYGTSGGYASGGSVLLDVNFSQSFASIDYAFTAVTLAQNDAENYRTIVYTVTNRYTNYVTVRRTNVSGTYGDLYYFTWIAIGRWK